MKKKLIVYAFIGIYFCLSLQAKLALIPFPKKVILKNSVFTINKNTKLISNGLDLFYENQLLNCGEQELNIKLKRVKRAKRNFIEFIKTPSLKEFVSILKENGLNQNFKKGEEAYVLYINPKAIKIISQTDAGIFYGIQTLKQIIMANREGSKIPCLVIYDYPDIHIRTWQDDISRGPIPKMSMLKEEIKKMAFYKLNYFSLYIEHVFKLEKHPKIAPKDGITKEEIKELREFAKKYHVNLIGSYQSFGHMEKTLSLPKYSHLLENNHIISPALKESYEFLNDVYEEIVPAFNSEYFNINCDETFGLGEGKSKNMVDSLGIEGVYLYHIKKLRSILQKYNKKILMWGDFLVSHKKVIEQLPKDITVMAWDYNAADNFENNVIPLENAKLNFWVAPGVHCWGNIFPNYSKAEINIYNFIRDGYKHNAKGVFNTTWDDDGLNFFQNNWHGLIWGAENSWNAPKFHSSVEESDNERKKRYSSFNRAFGAIFYGLKDDYLIEDIIEFSNLHQSGIRDILRNTRFFEPIFPMYNEYVSKGKKQDNLDMIRKLDELLVRIKSLIPKIKQNRITIDYLIFAMEQAQFTLYKNILRIELYDFINNIENISVSKIKNSILTLIEKAEYLKKEYVVLWNLENRKYWLESNIKKFNELIENLSNLEGHCIITPSVFLTKKGRKITMRSLFGDLPVYYSIDKDTSFTKYTEPLFFDRDVSIKAGVITKDKAYKISECNLIYHKGIGKLLRLNSNYSNYHPSYDGGGKYALLDGKQGSVNNLKDGKWQGFSGQNIDIEIDLGGLQSLNYFSMGFYQNTKSWVIFPKKIEIFVKNNIKDGYKLIKTIINTIPPEKEGSLKHNYKTEFQNLKTRYIRVIAHYYGKLPEWHPAGSNNESMIFSDEIILK